MKKVYAQPLSERIIMLEEPLMLPNSVRGGTNISPYVIGGMNAYDGSSSNENLNIDLNSHLWED